MGNWNINIQGVGCHHNSKPDREAPKDADVMAMKFAQQLRDAGHTVEHATFTSGGKIDLFKSVPPGTDEDIDDSEHDPHYS